MLNFPLGRRGGGGGDISAGQPEDGGSNRELGDSQHQPQETFITKEYGTSRGFRGYSPPA